jgi:Uma2 family endonuclease
MGANDSPLLLARHRLTVDGYYRMAEVGILPPGQRTELIDGEVIDMASIGSRHAAMVRRLGLLIDTAAAGRLEVRSQNPIRLDGHSEPEPDLLVVAWRSDFYAKAHPTPSDTKLLIEVADTTLRYDLQIKVPLYARHGVPEVWVIDLDAGQLLRHRRPQGEAYRLIETLTRPGVLVPDAAPELALDLSALPLAP